jgi:hypothetical protein
MVMSLSSFRSDSKAKTAPCSRTHRSRSDEFGVQKPSLLEMNARRPSTIVCDVGALPPDVEAVDALARLQLSARRLGLEVRLRHASSELQDLLVFAGLREVLRVEPGGQAEQREQRVGVEEEGELDDPPT